MRQRVFVFHLRRLLAVRRQHDRDVSSRRPRTPAPGLLQRCSCRSSSDTTGTTTDSAHWSAAGLHHRSTTFSYGRHCAPPEMRTERRTAHSLSLHFVYAITSCMQSPCPTQLPTELKLTRSSAAAFERHFKRFVQHIVY